VSTLKNFYILINKAEYDKAYDLLDDRFRLNAFKVFGAIEISKSEIDVELFSEFAETTGIFKSLSIKEIIKEEAEDNSSKIYYHQSVRLEEAKDPVEMPLVATLKKVDSEWKIVALDDWETS
jgi:predicted ribosome-associated RNA-binding protein Tma20